LEKTAYCPMCDEYQLVGIHHIEEIFPIKGEPIQAMSVEGDGFEEVVHQLYVALSKE
jgi:hypothetical protein